MKSLSSRACYFTIGYREESEPKDSQTYTVSGRVKKATYQGLRQLLLHNPLVNVQMLHIFQITLIQSPGTLVTLAKCIWDVFQNSMLTLQTFDFFQYDKMKSGIYIT